MWWSQLRRSRAWRENYRSIIVVLFVVFVYWKFCDRCKLASSIIRKFYYDANLFYRSRKLCNDAITFRRSRKFCVYRKSISHKIIWLWIEKVLEKRSSRRNNKCLNFEYDNDFLQQDEHCYFIRENNVTQIFWFAFARAQIFVMILEYDACAWRAY